MNIHLIAIGQRMDSWVNQGYNEYAKRMPSECRLRLIEIVPNKRTKNMDAARALEEESDRVISAIPARALVVALDVVGNQIATPKLAKLMQDWLAGGRDIAILIGGPDGLSTKCKSLANLTLSLSHLTFPHPLVRVIIAEQIYRAWTIIKGHPYHR